MLIILFSVISLTVSPGIESMTKCLTNILINTLKKPWENTMTVMSTWDLFFSKMPWNTSVKSVELSSLLVDMPYLSVSVVQENNLFQNFPHSSWDSLPIKSLSVLLITWMILELIFKCFIKKLVSKMKDIYSFSLKVKSLMKDSLSILMIYLPQEKLLNSILLMKKKLLSMLLDLKLREKVSLILEITVGIGISTKLEKIFIWVYVSLLQLISDLDPENSQLLLIVPLLIGSNPGLWMPCNQLLLNS